MEWISVKEKIPETADQGVLILDSDMRIDVARLISIDYRSMIMKWERVSNCCIAENGGSCCSGKNYDVTHWMPLPELPITCKCDDEISCECGCCHRKTQDEE